MVWLDFCISLYRWGPSLIVSVIQLSHLEEFLCRRSTFSQISPVGAFPFRLSVTALSLVLVGTLGLFYSEAVREYGGLPVCISFVSERSPPGVPFRRL